MRSTNILSAVLHSGNGRLTEADEFSELGLIEFKFRDSYLLDKVGV